MEATLEKLRGQYPSLYIPGSEQADRPGDGDLPDDVKPLSDASSVMEISRLVTHLTRAVAAARERVAALMQDLQPIKERMIVLNDECDEKRKVRVHAMRASKTGE